MYIKSTCSEICSRPHGPHTQKACCNKGLPFGSSLRVFYNIIKKGWWSWPGRSSSSAEKLKRPAQVALYPELLLKRRMQQLLGLPIRVVHLPLVRLRRVLFERQRRKINFRVIHVLQASDPMPSLVPVFDAAPPNIDGVAPFATPRPELFVQDVRPVRAVGA